MFIIFGVLEVLTVRRIKFNIKLFLQIKDKITQIQQSTQKHVINGDLKAEFISANLQLQCLLNCMLKYMNDPGKSIQTVYCFFFLTFLTIFLASTLCPDVLTTEQDAAEIWKSEHKCNCAWLLEKQDSRIKRLSRRHKDRFEVVAVTETIVSDALNDWESSIISASSSDDDEFLVSFARATFSVLYNRTNFSFF